MPVVTQRLKTTGMHCRSCSMLIDMTVGELDGVQSSESDAAAGTTVVVYDDQTTDVDAILGAIRGAGYDAEPES